ncbi:MAG: hypothetical protein AAGA84_00470 [Pseudomonadota bacterium]
MRHFVLLCIGLFSLSAHAQLDSGQLPGNADWYVHLDFEQMRTSKAAAPLFEKIEADALGEVREEVSEELGVVLDTEFTSFTVYGDTDGKAAAVLKGPIDEERKSALIDALADYDAVTLEKTARGDVYRMDTDQIKDKDVNIKTSEVMMSLARKNTIVVGTDQQYFDFALSDRRDVGRSLKIMAAPKAFVQIGVNADALARTEGGPWQSGLLRQTRELALVISDNQGDVDLHLNMTANDPATTDSIANVIRGLVGLQALSGDGNDSLRTLLSNLKIENDSRGLNVRLVVSPDDLMQATQ